MSIRDVLKDHDLTNNFVNNAKERKFERKKSTTNYKNNRLKCVINDRISTTIEICLIDRT